MKNYRNLNGVVSKMHRVVYEAYDKGYAQAKKDYKRADGSWKKTHEASFVSYQCSNCQSLVIAEYLYCPHCGSFMGGKEDDKA